MENENKTAEPVVMSSTALLNKFKRNELGLLEHVNYKFTEEDLVDWRALVNPKYLFLNKDNYVRRKETIPETIEGQKDSDLIIMLGGLRELAMLRGFTSITYRPIVAGNEYSATVCQINWVGNYETNMVPIISEDSACANLFNTGEMVQSYLIEMSTNRAFCRCIRNFLRIGIVSKEELPPAKVIKNNNSNNSEPATVLANLMKEKGKSFEEVMKKLVGEGYTEFGNYKGWGDIPGDKAFGLIDRFKNLKGGVR